MYQRRVHGETDSSEDKEMVDLACSFSLNVRMVYPFLSFSSFFFFLFHGMLDITFRLSGE